MIDRTLNLHQTNATTLGKRPILLGLLAAAHVAFAATCSPTGTRSGEWYVPWLPDPDALVFVASGAVAFYPLILFPVWVGLGCGDFLPRFGTGLLLCFAFVGASGIRGVIRNPHEPQIVSLVLTLVFFSMMTVCICWLGQFQKWRMRTFKAPTIRVGEHAHQPQCRLRHLLEAITLACCAMGLYRFCYPNGFPLEIASDWWQQAVRFGPTIPLAVLILLPAVVLPWLVLAIRRTRKSTIFVAAALLSCCVAFDYALIWLTHSLRIFLGQEILWIQLGATAAGLVSAGLLRSCGYWIFRIDGGPECAA